MKEYIYKKTVENNESLNNIFIPTNKEWESTENENLTIIESGKNGVLFNKIINDIKNAKNMVCLQSFLIQDTKIIDALVDAYQKRNVRVFILDSAEARLKESEFEEDESFATNDYINMLDEKFKYNFVHRQANNLHAKFILIDPQTNPKGYLFTGNFNKKPFFENPELAVPLSLNQIQELFQVFVYHFWEHTTDEQTQSEQFEKVKPLGKFKKPNLKSILITSPNQKLCNLKNMLIKSVNEAENEIIFSTFGFDINHELSKAILLKLKEGVKVTVFCRPREKVILNNIEKLEEKGANVLSHPLIHAKTLLIDNNKGFIFTANFESYGLDTGFEVGVELNQHQTQDLIRILDKWKNTFPLRFKTSFPLKNTTKYYELKNIKALKLILPEKTIEKKVHINTVKDMIEAISNIKKTDDNSTKKFIYEITMNFNELNDNYKTLTNVENGLDIIEIVKVKKKKPIKEKAILCDLNNFDINDKLLKKINGYIHDKIYVK